MPRIRDEYLNCSIYLYRCRHEAEEGINIGGSGFIVSVPATTLPAPTGFVYAVTNKHVIQNGACCIRVNMVGGGFDIFEISRSDWILARDDDLAICGIPFLQRDRYLVGTVGIENLLTEQVIRDRGFGPGDEVVLIGRFVSQEGKQQNLPSVRFGHISQMPIEPIEYKGAYQESFLCEVKSIGGFSGSPVFIAPLVSAFSEDDSELPQSYLLGVDWCHMCDYQYPIDDRGNEIRSMRVEINTGMMGVVPAWKLRALLESSPAAGPRRLMEETLRKHRSAPVA